ncbi:MAG: MAPEG family protein [Novosphingobium sp.]
MAATSLVGMAILKPVVALAAWTMVMWLWMYATRIPAMSKAGIDSAKLVGGTGASLDEVLPPNVQWIAHNYNHLHEAPTVFYAVALVLAITGHGDGLNAQIAWGYVGLRVVHSIVQASVNRVIVRFGLFALSSLALIALVVHAALAVF